MQIQRTHHGFDWSCAKIECLASDEKKGWVYLGVIHPHLTGLRDINLDRVSRCCHAKDSTNKKEML